MIIAISGKKQSGKDTVGEMIQYIISKKKLSRNFYNIENSFENARQHPFSLKIHSGWGIRNFAENLKEIVCLLTGCTLEQLGEEDFKNSPIGEEWNKYSIGEHNFSMKDGGYFSTLEEAQENCTMNREPFTSIKKITMTYRHLLQQLGTDWGRNIIHPNIWVNSLMEKYTTEKKESIITNLEAKGFITSEEGCKYLQNNTLPNWIITDVRMPNELKACKEREAITIRVNRNKKTSKEWYQIYYKVTIIDPNGWDRVNYEYSWSEELITLEEYKKRLNNSTYVSFAEGEDYIVKGDEHYSEIALDDYTEWDYVIDNEGSFLDLEDKVREILIKEKLV